MVKLKLPKTLRLATLDDVPSDNRVVVERVEQAATNNIVEGYRLAENPGDNFPYKFFAEINVDNDRLWALFKTMMFSMSEDLSLLIGHKDDENKTIRATEYQDKYTLYNRIEKYEKELTLDGFLKFGVISQTEDSLEEIFVHSAKYVQYWGVDLDRFKKIMDDYSLYPVYGLEFIDSYPMVTTGLHRLDAEALQTEETIEKLKKS